MSGQFWRDHPRATRVLATLIGILTLGSCASRYGNPTPDHTLPGRLGVSADELTIETPECEIFALEQGELIKVDIGFREKTAARFRMCLNYVLAPQGDGPRRRVAAIYAKQEDNGAPEHEFEIDAQLLTRKRWKDPWQVTPADGPAYDLPGGAKGRVSQAKPCGADGDNDLYALVEGTLTVLTKDGEKIATAYNQSNRPCNTLW